MSKKNRKDEDEEWEVEEHIVGVSNIDNGESDWEELLEQNIIPEEEWETEEHIVGVSNIEDDGGIDWEQISEQNPIPDWEEEWETEEYIAGVPNIDFYDSPIHAFPIERKNILEELEEIEEEQEKIEQEWETEEHIAGVSNLTKNDIILNKPPKIITRELAPIRRFANLYNLIHDNTIVYLDINFNWTIEIYYNGKCQEGDNCEFGIDILFIPALLLHHLLENYKKIIIKKGYEKLKPSDILKNSFDTAIELLKTQVGGLKLICCNHHLIKHHKRYNYKPMFDFLYNLHNEDIVNDKTRVIQKIRNLSSEYDKKFIGKSFKKFMSSSLAVQVKKKYSIEFLFGKNYICPICGKANINEHLVCFVAHHTNLDLFNDGTIEKIEFTKEYESRSVDWIIEKIIEQECVFICENCHVMLHSTNFRDYAWEIFNNREITNFIDNYYDKAFNKLSELREYILQIKKELISGNLVVVNPLGEIFTQSEALELNLVCIYCITEQFKSKDERYFTIEELQNTLDASRGFFFAKRKFRSQMLDLNLVNIHNIFKDNELYGWDSLYILTKKGKEIAKGLIELKMKKYPQDFPNLISTWEQNFNNSDRTLFKPSENLNMNLICIYYISKVFDVSKNTFTIYELKETLGASRGFFFNQKDQRERMLKADYVSFIGNNLRGEMEFQITLKGIKKAQDDIKLILLKYPSDFNNLVDNWRRNYNNITKKPLLKKEVVYNLLKTGGYTISQLSKKLKYSKGELKAYIFDLRNLDLIHSLVRQGREKVWIAKNI